MKLDPSGSTSGGSLSLFAPTKVVKLQKSQPVLRKFAIGVVPKPREGKVVVHRSELVLSGEPEEPHLDRRGS